MLRLAGFSSGRGDCARRGWSAERSGFLAGKGERPRLAGASFSSLLKRGSSGARLPRSWQERRVSSRKRMEYPQSLSERTNPAFLMSGYRPRTAREIVLCPPRFKLRSNVYRRLSDSCAPIAVLCVHLTPAIRFCWSVWRSVTHPQTMDEDVHRTRRALCFIQNAYKPWLIRAIAFGSRRLCVSVGVFRVWFTPVIRFYRDVLRSITPAVCRIAPNRTACEMLRSYSAVGRDRQ